MSNSPSAKALLILALTGSMGVGALAYYVKFEPGAAKPKASLLRQDPTPTAQVERRAKPTETEDDQEDSPKDEVSTRVFVPQINGTEAALKKTSTKVPKGQDPLVFVAKSCLKNANVDDVRVLNVDLNNQVAVVNFSREIEDGMGSEQEGSFIKALQVGYGQFSNIKRIEIYRDGAPLKSFGSIEISGPLDVVRGGQSTDQTSKPIEP